MGGRNDGREGREDGQMESWVDKRIDGWKEGRREEGKWVEGGRERGWGM